jgi:hypothetical protein
MKTFIRTHRSQNGWRQELNIYYICVVLLRRKMQPRNPRKLTSAADNAATQPAKTYSAAEIFSHFI